MTKKFKQKLSERPSSQSQLLMEYFMRNPKREIHHPEIVDWAVLEYKQRTGDVFRDPDRAIRKLFQSGWLIKIKKGVYKYDPDLAQVRKLKNFTSAQKKEIFRRDQYRCVVCGKGTQDGVEIHADHIMPKDLGGEATLKNGQTLCSQHNFQKKNYKQTETGKRMFIHLYELAKKQKDKALEKFCLDILNLYDKHNINGHIQWKK